MEASLITVTPAPIPAQETPSSATPMTDEATPFTTFLAAALNPGEDTQEETDGLDIDDATAIPGQQEMVMTAELTALSFQDIPALTVSQLVPGGEIAPALTAIADSSSPIIVPPAVTPDDLKQFQTLLTANGQMATELPPPLATEEQSSPAPVKAEPLVTQQLQAILTGNSQDTIIVHTPSQSTSQSTSTEALNGLSSPLLQPADSTTAPIATAHAATAHATIMEGEVKGTMATDTVEGVRQNVEEHYLNVKIEAQSDKNSAKNQQHETNQQENSASQQSTSALTPSLNNSEQTNQFIITGLGTQTAATTPGHTAVTHPAASQPGNPFPGEEIINHLVERFSINPRLQTSKVSLNLTPAELGTLKIDILVKGDSIKAHIIAGSQQIQETIEKNMPKLRAILEQQGFNIEDFQVTMESTTTDSNAFFQQQFSSRQDSAPQTPLAINEASFDLSLNSAEASLNTSMTSGVNLSI